MESIGYESSDEVDCWRLCPEAYWGHRPLVALDAGTPAHALLDIDDLRGSEGWRRPTDLRVLCKEKERYLGSNPEEIWLNTRHVDFRWFPGDAEEPLELVGLGEYQRTPRTVYVLDGGGIDGADTFGVPPDSDTTWLIRHGQPPVDLGNAGTAPEGLAGIVEQERVELVVFLPAQHWTVEDMVRLCDRAVPQPTGPRTWDFCEGVYLPRSGIECALSDHFPADVIEGSADHL